MARAPVRLNVYDMYWLNEYASTVGIGVYHSGVEVYGIEYAYGGHQYAFSGIFENSPQDAEELGENFKFRESILIGETDFTATDVQHMISLMGHDYRGDRYHLIAKNCNHFTATLAKTLTGRDVPGWINRLASISNSIPFLERCLPQDWLTPVALQQTLQQRRNSQSSNNTQTSNIDDASSTIDTTNERRSTRSSIQNGTIPINDNSSTTTTTTNGVGGLRSLLGIGSNSPRASIVDESTARVSTVTPPLQQRIWNSLKNFGDIATNGSSGSNASKQQ